MSVKSQAQLYLRQEQLPAKRTLCPARRWNRDAVCGTEPRCSPRQQQQARFHGAQERLAMEHTLLAPLTPQLNAPTHCCLSHLAPLRLARCSGTGQLFPILPALHLACCSRRVSSGQQGPAPGGFACRARAG